MVRCEQSVVEWRQPCQRPEAYNSRNQSVMALTQTNQDGNNGQKTNGAGGMAQEGTCGDRRATRSLWFATAPIESDSCFRRMNACKNRCSQSDMGLICHLCCHNQARKCDGGGDYSFYGCMDN